MRVYRIIIALIVIVATTTFRVEPKSSATTSQDPTIVDQPNDVLELVGHIGGTIEDVEVVGHYAYVAQGASLSILDVSDKNNPYRTGYIVFRERPRDIEVRDNYAYVANGNDGLRIVDVSDAYNPIEVGSCMTPTLNADTVGVLPKMN